ncbi:RHG07 protein, partial [Ramphastos sulfuratus]|nr:RHG07 protein [Ramphastos sulfuratus]
MSVAIRKKSWEEHVSQWLGLALEAVQCNAACRHGLPAEGLQAGMEQEEARGAGRQQPPAASFADCCYSAGPGGCPARHLRSEQTDGNDNHEDEDGFLEASTETLVHVSDEDDKRSALSLEELRYHHTAAAAAPAAAAAKESGGEEESLNGAAAPTQVPPVTESDSAAEASQLIGA